MGKVIPFIILLSVLLAVIFVNMIGYCKETKEAIIENIISVIIIFLFMFSWLFLLTVGGCNQKDVNATLVIFLFLFSLTLSDFLDTNTKNRR